MATGLEEAEDVCERVYNMVRSKLYGNLVRILMKHEIGKELDEEEEANLYKLTRLIYKTRRIDNKFINAGMQTNSVLIGVGGPTGIFLDEVANLLGTKAIIPEKGKVANAIGAAAGNISCSCAVRIEPNMNRAARRRVLPDGTERICGFSDYDEALEHAKIQAEEAVKEKAVRMGARDDIKVKIA